MRATGPTTLWRTIVTDTAERTDAGARLALEREVLMRSLKHFLVAWGLDLLSLAHQGRLA